MLLTSFPAASHAQNPDPGVAVTGGTLKKIIGEIENQTNYLFIYDPQEIDANRQVTVDAGTKPLSEVLSAVLGQAGIDYRIEGNNILLIKRAAEPASRKKISGTVLDENNQPLMGAVVTVKGSSQGAVADKDGRFEIAAAKGATLVVTFMGYRPFEQTVGDATAYTIRIAPAEQTLSNVVVTALGIRREEKTLSYNVQQIANDEFTTVKSANLMSSLAGKAAGVTINTSAAGPGAAVKVVMRGLKSITQSNNALYVIDGIPMFNSVTSGGEGAMASQPGSEAIADINPEDIESISMLTGPSAAALYGYEGANGVVLLTTKKGRPDHTSVTFSHTTTFSDPLMLPKFQNTYGNLPGEMTSWGPKTEERFEPRKFFNRGHSMINNVALSTGGSRSQSYLSVGWTDAEGILPNNKYERYNFSYRNTTTFFNDKLVLDGSMNYIIQSNLNMVSQGQYFNPLPALYLFPRGEDFREVRNFQRYDELYDIADQYWPYGDQGLAIQNPYWIMYNMNREVKRNRYRLSASLKYNITDWLNVVARANVDNTDSRSTDKRLAGTLRTFAGEKGRFMWGTSKDRQTYADALINLKKTFCNFSLHANLGASIRDFRQESIYLTGDLKHATYQFSVENMDHSVGFKVEENGRRQQTQSVFGNVELGYRSFLYLTATARNDWDSAMSGSFAKVQHLLYPSVGLSLVVSEMVKLPSWFTYLKLRGSYVEVGKSYDPHLTSEVYSYDPQMGQYKAPEVHYNPYLSPESTRSHEAGVNMKFFQGTLSLDATWFTAKTFKQTFEAVLSPTSGYSSVYMQAGRVDNTGVELALGYDNHWNRFAWSSNATFTFNENKIVKLATGERNPVSDEIVQMPYIVRATLGQANSPQVRLYEGGTMGDIYAGREFKRDNNGFIYLNPATLLPSIVNADYRKVGSLLPKSHVGWRNSFSYGNLRLNVMLNGRIGGVVVSNTQAILDRYGVSEYSARLREADDIVINERKIAPRDYLNIVAAGTGEGARYVYDATNFRLQEVSLEYTIPRAWLRNLADVTLGVVGNNLAMIYCKAPFDPELVPSATSTFYTGVDYFMQPSLRNIGFSVKVQF